MRDRGAYLANPEVWRDIKSVFESYLKLHPNSYLDRNWYAKAAVDGAHWAEANEQFTLLGDHPGQSYFPDQAAYDSVRKQAKEKTEHHRNQKPDDGSL